MRRGLKQALKGRCPTAISVLPGREPGPTASSGSSYTPPSSLIATATGFANVRVPFVRRFGGDPHGRMRAALSDALLLVLGRPGAEELLAGFDRQYRVLSSAAELGAQRVAAARRAAAAAIQAAERGRQARGLAGQMRLANLVHHSARRIQAIWRGIRARRAFVGVKAAAGELSHRTHGLVSRAPQIFPV